MFASASPGVRPLTRPSSVTRAMIRASRWAMSAACPVMETIVSMSSRPCYEPGRVFLFNLESLARSRWQAIGIGLFAGLWGTMPLISGRSWVIDIRVGMNEATEPGTGGRLAMTGCRVTGAAGE